MDILFFRIYLAQQFIMDPPVPALPFLRRERIIFVYTEEFHISERHFACLVPVHKFIVKVNRRGTGRESEFEPASCVRPDCIYDLFRDGHTGFLRFGEKFYRYLFIAVKDVFRQILFNKTSVFWQRKMFHHKTFLKIKGCRNSLFQKIRTILTKL